MLNQNVPPPVPVGEITVHEQKRQEWENDLTRSNWQHYFMTGSPDAGDDRRDGKTTPGSKGKASQNS